MTPPNLTGVVNQRIDKLPNKVYLLSWLKNGTERNKLLTKGSALCFVNDTNNDKPLRDVVLAAFKEGMIE